MAKKTAKGETMNAVQEKKAKGVRLDLSPSDHRRLAKLAKEKGLNMSAYARMALFERMRDDEERSK